jgi:uncharacterized membrane protein YkvA (DUF1232 family)
MANKTLKAAKKKFILSLVLLAGGIIYAVSPIDILPDFLAPLGWTDDIGVLLATSLNAAKSYIRMRRQVKQNNKTV